MVLGDGSTATIRPITPADTTRLQEFHARQSPESKYYRYFSPKPELSASEAERFTNVDFVSRAAFVIEDRGELIAWASYERWKGRPDAEVAFHVDDQYQGRGIATLLLEHLATVARSNGITRFTAETLAENRGMISVFTKAGWPVQRRFDSGVVDVDFPLDTTSDFVDSLERREQRADSRAIAHLLLPASIAVIGASDQPGTPGHEVWTNTVSGQRGRVYPVNPRRDTVGGRKAFNSVNDIPDEIGLAVVVVPAAEVPAVIDECIAKRVRGAVLITVPTIGNELDVPGLVQHARRNGLRIIGPASMGIASPRADTDLHATLIDVPKRPGNIAISMQSGMLGGSLLRVVERLEIGLSWFVSLGDKSDVSSNDLLQFWQDDDNTKVICLYTESVGNPRKFTRIAHRVAVDRPIIVVRTGAALLGEGASAMYRQSGVIEVPTVQAMLDTARVFATQPLLNGDRVAVISNSRSPIVSAHATLVASGLQPVDPPEQLDWRSTSDDYRRVLRAAVDSDDVDGIIVIHAPPTAALIGARTEAIEEAMAGADKPFTAVMLGAGDGPIRPGSPLPSFAFPEQAAAALGRLRSYTRWRDDELNADPDATPTGIDRPAAEAAIWAQLAEPAQPVPPERVRALLAAYGVRFPATRLVVADDAVAAAEAIGYPVAIKALRRAAGRSVEAGLALDLTDADDVAGAVATMREHLGADAAEVWVQHMVAPSVDLRVRVTADEQYGPLVSVGLGGAQADLIGDSSSRVAPIAPSAARRMLDDTKASATLTDDDDREAMIDLLTRVGQLASDHPEIHEFDLNPVVVRDGQPWVVDARLDIRFSTTKERPTRRLEPN